MHNFGLICALLMTSSTAMAQDGDLEVAMLLPGKIDDNGFMEAGYNGLLKIEDEFGATISYLDGIKPERDLLAAALRKLAEDKPDLVIAHGGQNSEAAQIVAAEFPDVQFVVVQGAVTGPNLSSYEVLQEESAWLAGAAAGLLTQTDVVGHISGIRVPPGLKGRGAFYHGLMHTNPDARFLTIFAGDQDDNDLSRRVAAAEISEGADIIFTMLNAGRGGATEAMRGTKTRHIGNVIDWTKVEPGVFIASAMADVGIPSVEAMRDYTSGQWTPGVVKSIGLEKPQAVSLALSEGVPEAVRTKIDALREKIVSDQIEVSTDYEGPELTP
jgi:basic membrane protein A and related proteins